MTDQSGVLIAGGGPVGSLAALLLAERGVPVTLFEMSDDLVIDYRASTIHAPTLDLLEDCGATRFMIDAGLICPIMQYRDRREGLIAEIDFSVLERDTNHPYRVQCEQYKLTGWLYERLDAHPLAQRLMGHELIGLEIGEDEVRATIGGGAGRQTWQGRYLIGTDGGRSTVRRLAGIDFPGYTHREQFLVAGTHHDFRAETPGFCSVNYVADPEEWFLLLEIPDMWRLILPVGEGVDADTALAEDYLQACLQNVCPRAEPYELLVRAIYRVHQRVAATYRRGPVLLAGDAAHINNPLGGMGLNGGLHDVIVLADLLARVWHGDADDRLLDSYEVQRKPAAIDGVDAATRRNKKLMEEKDPEVRRRNLENWRELGRNRDKMYAHALEASMIKPLRDTGLLPQTRV